MDVSDRPAIRLVDSLYDRFRVNAISAALSLRQSKSTAGYLKKRNAIRHLADIAVKWENHNAGLSASSLKRIVMHGTTWDQSIAVKSFQLIEQRIGPVGAQQFWATVRDNGPAVYKAEAEKNLAQLSPKVAPLMDAMVPKVRPSVLDY